MLPLNAWRIFFVLTFIQTGKLSTFQEHILFTATAWGVVEALSQDNFWLLLCHRRLSLYFKDKSKNVRVDRSQGPLWASPSKQDKDDYGSQDFPVCYQVVGGI